ncbi:Hypothetical predicted protein [Cloeon dipterum]|uniref:C-type lectin domain-containing protein n=1 Tax=Cloeon dipterum TaxID=197152 RepID=A0A8S1DKT1_9INSE|nr:Hypothetical predicted protein [Cloeon dipterum]
MNSFSWVLALIFLSVFENLARVHKISKFAIRNKGRRFHIIKCCGITRCIPKFKKSRRVTAANYSYNLSTDNKLTSTHEILLPSNQESDNLGEATNDLDALTSPELDLSSIPDSSTLSANFDSATFANSKTVLTTLTDESITTPTTQQYASEATINSITSTETFSTTKVPTTEIHSTTRAVTSTTTVANNENPCNSSRCSKHEVLPSNSSISGGKFVTKVDTSFFVMSITATQMQAAQNCLSMKMSLISLLDIFKLDFLHSLISDLNISAIWTAGSNEGNGSCDADALLSFAWCVKNVELDATIQKKITTPMSVVEIAQKALALTTNKTLTALPSIFKLPYLCEPNADLYRDSCSSLKCVKDASLVDASGNLKDSDKFGKWTSDCGTHFLFSKKLGTWQQNLNFCCSLGLEPIWFRNSTDMQCFSNLTKSNWTLNWNYWTAGRAMGAWGRWAWCSGSKAVPFTDGINWAKGQPDNSNPEELCVHMQVDRNGTGAFLTDRNCSHKYVIACQGEVPPKNANCTKPKCPTECKRNENFFTTDSKLRDLFIHGSWNSVCGKEYLFSKISTTWLDAWKYCCSVGMKLASVHEFDDLKCLSKMVNRYPEAVYPLQTNRDFWTSGTNLDCAGPHYWCSDGEKLNLGRLPNWKGGRLPSQVAGNCIFINLSNVTVNASVLGADACSAQKQFLCEVLQTGNKSVQIKRSCQEMLEVSDQEIEEHIMNSSALQSPIKRNLMIKYGQLLTEHVIRNLEELTFDDPPLMQSSFDGYEKCSSVYDIDECRMYSEMFYCGKKTDPSLTMALLDTNKEGANVVTSPTGTINTKYRTCLDFGPCVSDAAAVNELRLTGKWGGGAIYQISTGKKYYFKFSGPVLYSTMYLECCKIGSHLAIFPTLADYKAWMGTMVPLLTSGSWISFGSTFDNGDGTDSWCLNYERLPYGILTNINSLYRSVNSPNGIYLNKAGPTITNANALVGHFVCGPLTF